MLTDVELKEKLIAKISATDDSELLHQISRLIEFEDEFKEIYEMSPEEELAVNEGLEQIRNGQFISNEESNRRAEEWLKKFDGQ